MLGCTVCHEPLVGARAYCTRGRLLVVVALSEQSDCLPHLRGEAGGVPANIDDTLHVGAVNIHNAQLQRARAYVVNAGANLVQMNAKLWEAEANWRRARKPGALPGLGAHHYDQYKAGYREAQANVSVAEAGVEIGIAAVAQG